jgi:hypothetical protein
MGSNEDRHSDDRCVLSAIQGGYTALHEAIHSHNKDVRLACMRMHVFYQFVNDQRFGMSQGIYVPDKCHIILSNQVLDGFATRFAIF